MADNDRVDLSGDVSKISSEFLDHVETAAAEVKQQLETAAENKRKQDEATRSRKISIIAVAVGAVLVLVVSYVLVFGRSNEAGRSPSQLRTSAPPVTIADPTAAQKPAAPQPPRPYVQTPPSRGGGDSQVVGRPPDDYEQPGQEPGM